MHYSPWLARVVQQGYVDVKQPYSGKIRRISLLPSDVHTFFLISKDMRPLLANEGDVRDALSRYDQLFCHLTVTGLGGTRIEPHIEPWGPVIAQLQDLAQLTGSSRRVSLRFDPIVHWYEGDRVESSLHLARPILEAAAAAGITTVRISFATLYPKVLRRKGVRWYNPGTAERQDKTAALLVLAATLGLTLVSCSQQELVELGVKRGSCIDGLLFSELHPRQVCAVGGKDGGQRRDCGCTPSVDIGSYDMRCPNGCRYCYANPAK